jgi:excisionase family DNA binding protein
MCVMSTNAAPHREPRQFLTVKRAADITDCHPATVRRAIERGELDAVRLGRRGSYRIRPAALGDWLTPAHNPKVTTQAP